MTEIKTQLSTLLNKIEQFKNSVSDQDKTVKLLAVSKTWPAEKLRIAFNAGQFSFGENYLQEALIKISALSDLEIEWHFIGPIQSNKTREIAEHFDWVQSVDRWKIAQRLSKQRPAELAPLNVCLQINIDDEESKSGIAADDTLDFAAKINQLDNLQLRGLMIIPAKTDDPLQQRDSFHRARKLYQQLSILYPSVDTLSMGMSADMQEAIEQGSTMVRIGSALFGQRHTLNKT